MSRILWGDYCFVVTDRRVAINTYADGCKKLGAGVIGCWSRLPFLFFQPPRVLFDDSLIVKGHFVQKSIAMLKIPPCTFFGAHIEIVFVSIIWIFWGFCGLSRFGIYLGLDPGNVLVMSIYAPCKSPWWSQKTLVRLFHLYQNHSDNEHRSENHPSFSYHSFLPSYSQSPGVSASIHAANQIFAIALIR